MDADEKLAINDTTTNNNNITTYDCDEDYFSSNSSLSSIHFHSLVYTMYCLILVIAVLGNGAVCFIVSSTPRMQTVTNLFITNLAIGDLLMAVFCVPFTFVPMFVLQYWPFGALLCPVVNYSQAISVFVSAYTLVAISINRYMAIMWPLKPKMTKRHAGLVVFVVWLFAVLTALPIPIFSELTQPSEWYRQCNRYVCREEWPTSEQNDTYTVALMMLQFIIPLMVLIFTYTSIAIVVWCKRVPGEAENSRDQRLARSKRKMIKMMLAVVVVFTLCWLPFNIFLVATYSKLLIDTPAMSVWLALHWLAMSHSCYNPIIYCFMNARFRVGFLQMLTAIPCCKRCSPLAARAPRSTMAFGLTGSDSAENSLLHRVNTSTTYITMRHTNCKMPTTYQCHQHPIRSASVIRCTGSNCNITTTGGNATSRRPSDTNQLHEDQI